MYTWKRSPSDAGNLELLQKEVPAITLLKSLPRIKSGYRSLHMREGYDYSERTVLLDLDGTLVKSCRNHQLEGRPYDLKINEDGDTYYIYVRPFSFKFVFDLAACYNVCFFTTHSSYYATCLADYFDPTLYLVESVFSQKHCWDGDCSYFKDLRFQGFDLKNTIIVDSCFNSLACNWDNSIMVTEYDGSRYDKALVEAYDILIAALDHEDVQPFLKRLFNLRENLIKCLLTNDTSLLPDHLPYPWSGARHQIPVPPVEGMPGLIKNPPPAKLTGPHFVLANGIQPQTLFPSQIKIKATPSTCETRPATICELLKTLCEWVLERSRIIVKRTCTLVENGRMYMVEKAVRLVYGPPPVDEPLVDEFSWM
eukprot:Platyproteum_vivax@DN7075_c0_g1_i4.p1